jgi:hypothetical protein
VRGGGREGGCVCFCLCLCSWTIVLQRFFVPHSPSLPPSLPPPSLPVSGTGAILRAAGFEESADTWDLRPSEHGWNLLCSTKAELDSAIAALPPSLPPSGPGAVAGAGGLGMPPPMMGGGGGGGMGGGMGGMDPAMLQRAMGMMQDPVSGRGGREGGREGVGVCLLLSLIPLPLSLPLLGRPKRSSHSHTPPSLPPSLSSLRPCVVKSCSNSVPPTPPLPGKLKQCLRTPGRWGR